MRLILPQQSRMQQLVVPVATSGQAVTLVIQTAAPSLCESFEHCDTMTALEHQQRVTIAAETVACGSGITQDVEADSVGLYSACCSFMFIAAAEAVPCPPERCPHPGSAGPGRLLQQRHPATQHNTVTAHRTAAVLLLMWNTTLITDQQLMG
jgi:hypothetical protein